MWCTADKNRSQALKRRTSPKIDSRILYQEAALAPILRSLVSSAIQFVSHVFPPSSEKACSKWQLLSAIYYRPDVPHKNHSSVYGLLVVELSTPVPELPHGWYAHHPAGSVGEIQAPLVRGRVVQPEVDCFHMAGRTFHLQLHHVGLPSPNAVYNACAFVFNPCCRSRERMTQDPQVCLPRPDFEIEIVLSVMLRRRCSRGDRDGFGPAASKVR